MKIYGICQFLFYFLDFFQIKEKLAVSNLHKEVDKIHAAFKLDGGNWEILVEGLTANGHCQLENYEMDMIRNPNFTKIGGIIHSKLLIEHPSITLKGLKEKVTDLQRNDLCKFLIKCVCAEPSNDTCGYDQPHASKKCCCPERDVESLVLVEKEQLKFFLGKYHEYDGRKDPLHLVDKLFKDNNEAIKNRIKTEQGSHQSPTIKLIELLGQRNSKLSLILVYRVLVEKKLDDAASQVMSIIEKLADSFLLSSSK